MLTTLIGRRLEDLGVAAETIAKGDLTVKVRSRSRDEVGWLEHSMRELVDKLRSLVTQMATSSRGLAVAAELEAQRAAQPQIVIELIAQRAHDALPDGQDLAMACSRSTSTRA